MGFGDEDWKRWEMDAQISCSEVLLQAQVWMEINTLTKHLLTATTSETCTSDLLAGTEPHSRRHLKTATFVQVAKVRGAEQNVRPRDNPQGKHRYTKIKVFAVQPRKFMHNPSPQCSLPLFPPRLQEY